MKRIFKILSVVILCLSMVQVKSQPFNHPGILNSKSELDLTKLKIEAGIEPYKSYFETLKSSPYASLSYNYQAFSTVECGSYNKPNIGCNDIVDDGMAVYSLSLMWYFTGNKQFADKAIEILNAWSNVYVENTNSNARLVVSWASPWYVNGAEILRYTNSGWTNSDLAKFNGMLDKFLPYVLDETMPGNNWIQSAIEAHFAIAVFKDDRTLFNKAVARWKERVKTYIYLESDGSIPTLVPFKTADQTISIWRSNVSNTAFINGLAMETCRDLGHLKLGFSSMMYGAETAWQQGVDLFSFEKNRITAFMELHGSWMTGSVAVPSTICDGNVIVTNGDQTGISPPKGGGEAAWEIAYNHFHSRLGANLPYTEKMLASNRPVKATHWVAKWESLTHANRSFNVDANLAFELSISKPMNQILEVYPGYELNVEAKLLDASNDLLRVNLYINNDSIRSITHSPFIWGTPETAYSGELNNLNSGSYTIKLVARSKSGKTSVAQFQLIVHEKLPVSDTRLVFSDNFNRGKEESPVSSGGLPRTTYTTKSTCSPVLTEGGTSKVASTGSSDYLLQLLTQHNNQTGNQTQVSAPLSEYALPFRNVLSENSGNVSWSFTFKSNRSSSGGTAGFAGTNQGAAVVLSADGENFTSANAANSNGYAVVILKVDTKYAVSLVKFAGSLSNSTTLIGPTNEISSNTNWMSVSVRFEPVSNTWSLYFRDENSNSAKGDVNVAMPKIASVVDATYTAKSMTHFGFVANSPNAGSSGANGNAFIIDDYQVAVDAITSLTRINSNNSLVKVFPNPAKNVLRVETNRLNAGASYKIYTLSGMLISQGNFSGNTDIGIAFLNSNYYILSVATSNGIETLKFKVEK